MSAPGTGPRPAPRPTRRRRWLAALLFWRRSKLPKQPDDPTIYPLF
ncbi:hypothetical protein [Streptomyces sp. NPDC058371]